MPDVCKKVIAANAQRNNRVTVLQNGRTPLSRDSGENKNVTVESMETRFTDKFDDTLYYNN